MQYTWEEQDIYCGRRVAAHNRSEQYIIGYNVSCESDRLCLISLSDGMITAHDLTKQGMARRLNESKIRPEDIRQDDL